MALSVRSQETAWGLFLALYGKPQKRPGGPPTAISVRSMHAAPGPRRCCIENHKKAGLGLTVVLYGNLGHDSMCPP